jgi:glycosyltransferase involved in cell wall biosynthesis
MKLPLERLAIYLPALYGGGAERTMLKLACGMSARGYPVDLVLARARGPYLDLVPESVRLIDLHAPRDILSLLPLVRYLRQERPDVLLSGLHTNIIALWARWLARVPTRVVISERSTFSQYVKHLSADIRVWIMPQLARWFYPWADSIVTVSQGVADDLRVLMRSSDTCIQAIYNPVVTPELRAQVQADLDHPWFRAGEPPVVLSIGRLTSQKDYPLLIKAFSRVLKTHQARLLILGEGEERLALNNLIQELGLDKYVSMPGFVSNPLPYIVRSTAFVLSSQFEGLPGVLIEAMYCGIPLISTDCPSGPREILADGEYGRLVPVGDADALSVAICDALDNKISCPPSYSWERFSLDAILDQYVEVFFGRIV